MNPRPIERMEFVWRRLEEPAELFGMPLSFDPYWWLAIAIPLLLLAFAFVVLTYRRESKTIGPKWSAILGILRVFAYLTLFFIWLLPAMRQVKYSEQQSKVALLFDISASITETSDRTASDVPGELLLTRQEELLELLKQAVPVTTGTPTPPDFLTRLLSKNPLICYRFGETLDSTPWLVPNLAERPSFLQWQRLLQPARVTNWNELPSSETLTDLIKLANEADAVEPANQQVRHKALVESLDRTWTERQQAASKLAQRTNPGLALKELLQKEKGNLQGVIVFSDGKATAGSTQDWTEAMTYARKEGVPVFTVGLGVAQSIPNLRVVDVLAPTRVQPEDDFPVRVAIDGDNLPAGQAATVVLQVERPGEKPGDLPAQQLNLIQGSGNQTRGTAEFRITNPKKIKGDWKFKARVIALPGERTRADNASEEATIVKVEERKLSVLLFASAATKEYQFLRSLMARESEKFDISICLQSMQNGTVQDIDPSRLLDRFPTELRARDADPKNLGNYDVIVAFDPDWRYLLAREESSGRESSQELLRRWVQDQGGGLITIAGPVHTFNLVRDAELNIIQNLYPVIFDDSPDALHILDRSNREPWALNWDPSASSQPYLDLTNSGSPARFFDGWDLFFDAQRNNETNQVEFPSVRGFFSYFPIRQVRPGAQVLARYGDPNRKAQTPNGERQPFFVLSKSGKGNVFFIGSGETYRLRSFSERFHERFWTKLMRAMGKRESSRGLLMVSSRHNEGDTILVEAELLDNDLRPLQNDARTPVLLKVNAPPTVTDVPKEWKEGLPMLPDKGKPGAFATRFNARNAGKYNVELRVPGTGEKLTANFIVESSDPERDDVRPDHPRLHRLASPSQGVKLLDETKRASFMEALAEARKLMLRDAQTAPGGVAAALTPENDLDRLYFNLNTMQYIPECLDSNIVPFTSEGRVYDLWDKGITIFQHLDDPEQAKGPSWALLLCTLLLGSEWLIRKLLRLA
ncbi:MAG: hypothetical protein U0796_11015 [Gemmatales bacterium]